MSIPAQQVTVSGFWRDGFTVTNEQLACFVEATGYVTVAQQPLNPADQVPLLVQSLGAVAQDSGPGHP